MSTFFAFVWFVSLIAFIVFWRKKVGAKKTAGDSYESDENYLQVSKTKRIIGIVCAASFVLAMAFYGGGNTSTNNTAVENKPKPETSKPAAENNLLGEWYCVKKDSSGTVTSIIFLNIKDEKSAQIDSYELTNNKFSENAPNKLLWRWGSLNVDMKQSGKNLKFFVKVSGGDDMDVLECKYDSDKLVSKDDTFTKEAVDIQSVKNESINQYKNYLESQGTKVEIVADMSEAEYKDYINKQIFGLP